MYTVSCIKYKKIIPLALILYTVYCILHTTQASAAGISLGIEPPILQVNALPPATVSSPLSIKNFADTPVTLGISIKPFSASKGENGTLSYSGDEQVLKKLGQYVHIQQDGQDINQLTLPPQTDAKLQVVIDIPKDEPAKDYYFSILFISNQDTTTNQSADRSYTTGGIATNVLLSVGPFGDTTGTIEEFSAPFFVDKGPIPFTLRVKNTSSHVIAPSGEILITNMFGQTIGKVELLPVNILTDSVRAIPDSLAASDSKTSASLTAFRQNQHGDKAIWPETFLIGPYTANLRLVLSDSGPVFRRSIHFVALPIQAVLTLLVVIIIGLYMWSRVKKYRS